MLLLARRIHEEIVVIDNETGEQIVVTPTGYRGNQVKIGIEASKARFTILRREVLERERAATLTWSSTIRPRLRAGVATPALEIVDGFHRWTVSARPEIADMTGGLVPVVVLD